MKIRIFLSNGASLIAPGSRNDGLDYISKAIAKGLSVETGDGKIINSAHIVYAEEVK